MLLAFHLEIHIIAMMKHSMRPAERGAQNWAVDVGSWLDVGDEGTVAEVVEEVEDGKEEDEEEEEEEEEEGEERERGEASAEIGWGVGAIGAGVGVEMEEGEALGEVINEDDSVEIDVVVSTAMEMLVGKEGRGRSEEGRIYMRLRTTL
ncbi:MAG: hypothetical protein LQ343_003447 [Gyalolechia ehrenbergii]|nr:MAG: hypothetical protein LQ343_003447 [Gyalolechia ehrenbergii]